ncbi:MAG: holo-ACP synthase [Planctomycetes bacterium]|nr:holo-ACP synthase [Planctomycetota bacterium]
MIIGCGIDIIELQRMKDMIEQYGARFLTKVFSDSEISYCLDRKKSWQHFAGRFAVKEAVLKCLGTGIQSGITWKDVEVLSERMGSPKAVLRGGAERRARELGVKHIHISISHSDTHAVAQAVAEG